MGIGPLKRAVFLDRDGVLNAALVRDGKPYAPASIEEVRIVADAPEALARLKSRAFSLIVITNQPDVARGIQTIQTVDAIDRRLRRELPLDDFFTCYHDDRDQCACRKPKPGLILQAAARHGLDPAKSFMVGDRWRDIDAGRAAGCRTVWIDRGYSERGPSAPPDARVHSVSEAADWILREIDEEGNFGPKP
jgi:D-glycero-D-manno-heptose 1,7-bisphosphate phosphatase